MYIISRHNYFVKKYFMPSIKKPSDLAGLKKWGSLMLLLVCCFQRGITHTLLLCVPTCVKDLSLLCPTTDSYSHDFANKFRSSS